MLEQFKGLLEDLNIYYTPTYLQLKALLEERKETICILDREKERYYFCYYCDSRIGLADNINLVICSKRDHKILPRNSSEGKEIRRSRKHGINN
jgi:hypothetical protein